MEDVGSASQGDRFAEGVGGTLQVVAQTAGVAQRVGRDAAADGVVSGQSVQRLLCVLDG